MATSEFNEFKVYESFAEMSLPNNDYRFKHFIMTSVCTSEFFLRLPVVAVITDG